MLGLAFRQQRWSLVAFSLGTAMVGFVNSLAFVKTAGPAAAEQAQFGREMAAIASQFTILTPLPLQVGTMAGYVQWRYFGAQVPILLAIWAVSAGTGLRGDEEKGLVENWLAGGVSKLALLGWRALAFGLGLVAMVVLVAGLSWAGAQPQGGLGWAGLLADGLAAAALVLSLYGIGALASQLAPTRRSAAGLAGGATVILFLLNGLGRSDAGFARYRGLSPFYWYERTDALLVGGRLDLGATSLLGGVALVLLLLSWLGFRRRDLGSSWFRLPVPAGRPEYRPRDSAGLELPVLAGLYPQRLALAVWALGLAALAYLMVVEAKPLADAITGIPGLAPYLTRLRATLFVAFVDIVGFGIATPMLAVFTITQVSRWAGDDGEGRLELVLAEGVRRERVVIERVLGLALAAGLLSALTGAVVFFESRALGFELDAGRVALASALMVPLALSFGVAGSVIAAWRPRIAVPALTFLVVAGYFITQLGPIFRWPAWADDLSPFYLYGNPLSNGIYWTGFFAMAAITGVGLVLSLLAMRRREVGR